GHAHYAAERRAQADAQRHADDAADQAEDHALGDELHADGGPRRAQRLAGADLPGAFGDRDHHDVHDADAAHQQRDGCNGGNTQRHGVEHLGHGFHQAGNAAGAGGPGVVVGVIAGEKAAHRVHKIRHVHAVGGHDGHALVTGVRPGDSLGHIQRAIDAGLDLVVVGYAEHAGVDVLGVLIDAVDVEGVQTAVDVQRERLADGLQVAAADGLLHELFRHHGHLPPGVLFVVEPA